MLTYLYHLLGARPGDSSADQAFVQDVRKSHPREHRSRRSERVLVAGWVLIAIKCVLVWWVIRAYEVPVHPGWVILPTIGAAGVCTWLYWRR